MAGRPRTIPDERIFAAVRSAVGRVGIARLTLAEVARDAGVTTGALAQRFSTKRNLLLSFSRNASGTLAERMREVHAGAPDPVSGLEAALVALVDADFTAVEFANHLSFLGMELADEEFRAVLVAQQAEVRRTLEDLLRAAVAEGALEVPDVPALARVLVSLWHGVQVNWSMNGGARLPEEMRQQVGTVLRPFRPTPER